jgi:hypothetical protein
MVQPNILRNNRWRCDHGWDVDLDDGSSNYQIYNNLMLRGGLKLREGFHRRVWNNITVNNSLHPHVWFDNSGDMVTNNIFMGAYRPAGGMPKGAWGKLIDYNVFATSKTDRDKFATHGCDAHSIVAKLEFKDPAKGDFQLSDESPALRFGFENFPMDQFGVQKPELKALARIPEIPAHQQSPDQAVSKRQRLSHPHYWQQAIVRNIEGDEFSAFGVSKRSGGVHLAKVPQDSQAAESGFETGDLIQNLNGQPVKSVEDLFSLHNAAANQPLTIGFIRAQQPRKTRIENYTYVVSESAPETVFKTVPLRTSEDIVRIRSVHSKPSTVNEPLPTLHNGRLADNYGPVFQNGVNGGRYKVDLGAKREIAAIATWSYNQNGNRGSQRFLLFGSAADQDPGWDVQDTKRFTLIAEVWSRCSGQFHGTRVQSSTRDSLGSYRWLVWAARPVTKIDENTAFQEFQVHPLK